MTESVLDYMTRLGRAARQAARVIARASTAQKNRALHAAANALDAARDALEAANAQDLAAGRANDEPIEIENEWRSTDIGKDLKRVRNVKPLWSKFGTAIGVALGALLVGQWQPAATGFKIEPGTANTSRLYSAA